MTSLPLFVMANEGPLSPVLIHLLSIIREAPLASHGAVKEPVPTDPSGQSGIAVGSGSADTVAVETGTPPSPARALASSMPFFTPAHTTQVTIPPIGRTTKNTISAKRTPEN